MVERVKEAERPAARRRAEDKVIKLLGSKTDLGRRPQSVWSTVYGGGGGTDASEFLDRFLETRPETECGSGK